MQNHFLKKCVSALALFGCLLVFSTTANAGDYYTKVSRATQIPDQFSTDVPLYIKGTVPPGSSPWSEAQLEDLGRQIAELNRNNRQKFGVLLIENFDDETYRVENQTFRGTYSAVDAAIDIGLHNHPEYQREDWAWITICFQQSREMGGQRPVTYYASSQLKEWRLGVGNIWKGDLDAFMIQRLKSRHIKAAATDTIVEVNRRLERAIQAEANRKAELKREGIAALGNAESQLALLNTNLTKLKAEFPDRTGNLFFPDLSSAQANLESARAAVASEDYQRARSAGTMVIDFVNEHQRFIDEYKATPNIIDEVRSQLAILATHSFFDSARSAHATASTSADEAMKAYNFGNIEYLVHRNRAVTQSSDAVDLADAAQSRHQAFIATMTVLGLIVLAILAMILYVLRSRSQKALGAFQELLDTRRRMLDDKRVGLRALQSKKVDIIGASKRESDLTSDGDAINRTEKDVDEAGTLVGSVFIMLSCADDVVDRAVKMATPSSLIDRLLFGFRTQPYTAARAYLSDTEVAFDKQSGLRFAIDSKEVPTEQALWKDISEFDDFKMNFVALNEVIAEKSKRANGLLDGIKEAVDRIGPTLDTLSQTLHGFNDGKQGGYDAFYAKICATWVEDGSFVLNEYSDSLMPGLDAELERLTKLAKSDPISAYEESDNLVEKVEALLHALGHAEAVASHYKSFEVATQALTDFTIDCEWMKRSYREILEKLDAYFASLTSDREAWKIYEAKDAAATLNEKVHNAVKLATSLRKELEPRVDESREWVRSTRISIASGIEGVDPADVLCEFDDENNRDLNPDTHLKAASTMAESCATLLSSGSVEAATESLNSGIEKLVLATEITTATIKAHEDYKGRVATIVDRGSSLERQVPEHEEILLGIIDEFDDAVLLISSGDRAASDNNGTVEDNFDEIRTASTLRDEHLQDAEDCRSEGKLLEATEALVSAEATNAIIKHRLDGVANKRERLDATVRSNTSLHEKLERQFLALGKSIADPRVMKPTISQFDSATEVLNTARMLLKASKPDPFTIEDKLQHVKQAFASVEERVALDRELFAQANSSLASAEGLLKKAEVKARSVVGMADNIPDSPKLKAVPGTLAGLRKKLERAQALIKVESGDWNEVDDLATQVESEAEALRRSVTAQSALGTSAVDAINAASSKVRAAINWTGSYGVTVYGRPGSSQLDTARSALSRGDYEGARQAASQARSAAVSAISSAEAEVARKRRAEEERRRRERERRRREEEARRQREAAAARRRRQRSSSSSSSSSFGGFSSSGGSSSFGGYSSSGGSSGW